MPPKWGAIGHPAPPHRLSGNWSPCWECHIEPDWLLIWYQTEEELVLAASGTHSDLFG
ncbi:type II toxin-antitoxin system YafQ family toxin [Magnetospirillum fulvum]|uniref:type II toxin-antitoxin system YafQ family toxin n=1 Tax=Magnetospirillum fulvum TaxID=1082 RepID=UPI001B8BD4DB|nr:type II toxin-antitoxin system YafQ family toxin [Magnetospirillum fulvum]